MYWRQKESRTARRVILLDIFVLAHFCSLLVNRRIHGDVAGLRFPGNLRCNAWRLRGVTAGGTTVATFAVLAGAKRSPAAAVPVLDLSNFMAGNAVAAPTRTLSIRK